jgi:hypothetical protein
LGVANDNYPLQEFIGIAVPAAKPKIIRRSEIAPAEIAPAKFRREVKNTRFTPISLSRDGKRGNTPKILAVIPVIFQTFKTKKPLFYRQNGGNLCQL